MSMDKKQENLPAVSPLPEDREIVDEIRSEVRRLRQDETEVLTSSDELSETETITIPQAMPVRSAGEVRPVAGETPIEPTGRRMVTAPEKPYWEMDEAEPDKKKKKKEKKEKKEKMSRRSRRKQKELELEQDMENDIYQGVRIRTYAEIKREMEENGPEMSEPTSTFTYLFDDTKELPKVLLTKDPEELKREREERAKQAMEDALHDAPLPQDDIAPQEEVPVDTPLAPEFGHRQAAKVDDRPILIDGFDYQEWKRTTNSIPVITDEVIAAHQSEEAKKEALPIQVGSQNSDRDTLPIDINGHSLETDEAMRELEAMVEQALSNIDSGVEEITAHEETVVAAPVVEQPEPVVDTAPETAAPEQAAPSQPEEPIMETVQETAVAEQAEPSQPDEPVVEAAPETTVAEQEEPSQTEEPAIETVQETAVAEQAEPSQPEEPVVDAAPETAVAEEVEPSQPDEPIMETVPETTVPEQAEPSQPEAVVTESPLSEQDEETEAEAVAQPAIHFVPVADPERYRLHTIPVRTFRIDQINDLLHEELHAYRHPKSVVKKTSPKKEPVQDGDIAYGEVISISTDGATSIRDAIANAIEQANLREEEALWQAELVDVEPEQPEEVTSSQEKHQNDVAAAVAAAVHQAVAEEIPDTAQEQPVSEETTEIVAEATEEQPVSEETTEPVAEATVEEQTVSEETTEPVTEAAVEDQPVSEEKTEIVAEATEEQPVSEEKAEPVAETPVEEQPVSEEKTESIAEATVEEQPVSEETTETVAEAPVEEQPISEETAEPVAEATVEEAPVSEKKTEIVAEAPVEEQPVLEETAEPVIEVPVPQPMENIFSGAVTEPEPLFPEEAADEDHRKIRSLFHHRRSPEQEIPEEHEAEGLSAEEEFTPDSDPKKISRELKMATRELHIRTVVTGFFTAALLVLGFVYEKCLPDTVSPLPYLILTLACLLAPAAVCAKTIWNGVKALFSLQGNTDSGISIAVLAAILHTISMFFRMDALLTGTIHLYGAIAVGALLLNSIGKLSMMNRIGRNFIFVNNADEKCSVEFYDDINTAIQLAKGCVNEAPKIAYQQKTRFLKNFLRHSYEGDPSMRTSQLVAPIALVASVVLCIVTMIITGDVVLGLTALSVATCISSPIAGLLCVNLPVANLCNLARRHGAMLSGYEAVEKLSNTNAVMIDSTDLFPKNSISLGDIRIYGGGKQIDQSIRNAAAVMSNTGGTLRDLFEGVISSQKEMLPKATSIAYVENQGMSGIVNGKRVLVGNRTMMEQNNIALPNDSRQVKLKSNERVIFLAEDNRPMAMLTVTYDPDPSTVHEMQRLESCGIAAIVRTLDPNLTSDFLSTLFLVEENAIKVLPDELGTCCDRVLQRETDACDALLATRGKSFSMMRMLSACVRQKHNIALAVTMQIVSIILGFVLVSFLSCYAGLQQLSTIAILIYELVWLAAIIIIPKLRKP